ncbi:MAG: GNAT family N-acetyltransferase [Candidatus Bathyarchaeota archaeon]|nr:GNAT family N-acetyltransferase [Candidatus Bathyarchaeum sp.]
MLKLNEVDNFDGVKETWDTVLESNLFGNNVFLTWAWLSTWWKHFGSNRRLLLLTVEDEDKVCAIAPLMLSKYKMPGLGSVKKVEFVGTRHSDYNNFIIAEQKEKCLNIIMDYLVNVVADWDWIELKEIPESKNYSGNLFSNVPFNLDVQERVYNVCPYITLPDSFESFMKGLSCNMRQDLNKKLRRIKQNHKIDFKKFDEVGLSVNEAINVFMEIHQKKWNSEGLSGAFHDGAFRDFHVDVAERFNDKNWLSLYFLMANDEPIAGHYSFDYAEKTYYYLSGFLPEYSVYSAGSLTIMLILKRCIENGIKEYDLMRGAEAYKKRWTHTYRKNFEVRLVRNSLHSKFYNWITCSSTVDNLAKKLSFSLKKDILSN